jgi:hypothetical protein
MHEMHDTTYDTFIVGSLSNKQSSELRDRPLIGQEVVLAKLSMRSNILFVKKKKIASNYNVCVIYAIFFLLYVCIGSSLSAAPDTLSSVGSNGSRTTCNAKPLRSRVRSNGSSQFSIQGLGLA